MKMRFKTSLLLFSIIGLIFAGCTKDITPPVKDEPSKKESYVFLIFGYGIPKDIFQDENYKTYLNITFNTIFDKLQKQDSEAYVIFSGGKTDMIEPYTRSEANEMKKYFESLLQRPFLKDYAEKVNLLVEEESFSTLENMLFTNKIVEAQLDPTQVFIFAEKTRENRIKVLADKIYKIPFDVYPVDFDKSEQRYNTSAVVQKENIELQAALWALESSENTQEYHELFKGRIDLLRKASPEERPGIQQEFRKQLEMLTQNK